MPRYLLVGHLTRDLVSCGFRYGGAVLYGGLTARRFGFETKVVTACAEPDLDLLFPEISFFVFHSSSSTVFENIETSQGREQIVWQKAPTLDLQRLPKEWRKADIVHLAPVLDEIDPGCGPLFETSFLVANPQGWFRQVLASGHVVHKRPDLSAWPVFEALVVSEEDLHKDLTYLPQLRPKTKLLVLTQGAKGAWLFFRNQEKFFPAKLLQPKDTTGAGDILAAAFFAALFAGFAPEKALTLAMCLAALSVTREGLAGVPSVVEISRYLQELGYNPKQY